MGPKKIAMKILVTGGGGFLGGAIVQRLVDEGNEVHCMQRGRYPRLEKLGVHCHTGDLADHDKVVEASHGCELVFHVAAKAGVWGDYDEYYRSNVVGTANVIYACLKNNIGRLVYTSSPSVVFDGQDEEGIDESTPYPSQYLTHYQTTKAIAERKVIAANSKNLATVALRPHLIWGYGDPQLIGRIISRAKSGKLRLVGKSKNLVDSTYIDNAVAAHLCASKTLQPGAACAGKTYFISNGEPVPMDELINRILSVAQLPPVSKTIPAGLAYLIGAISEGIYHTFGIKSEPIMTRFIAKQLTVAHWYDISAAKRDLAYEPKVSIEEGFQRLQQAMAHEITS